MKCTTLKCFLKTISSSKCFTLSVAEPGPLSNTFLCFLWPSVFSFCSLMKGFTATTFHGLWTFTLSLTCFWWLFLLESRITLETRNFITNSPHHKTSLGLCSTQLMISVGKIRFLQFGHISRLILTGGILGKDKKCWSTKITKCCMEDSWEWMKGKNCQRMSRTMKTKEKNWMKVTSVKATKWT